MFILEFFPDSAIHLLLVIGILGVISGFILGFIPIIDKYKLPIQIISILILSISIYFEGGISEEAVWNKKMSDLKIELAQAKANSAKINTVLVTKVLTKKQIVKEKGDSVIQYIDREVTKYDTKYDVSCPIPNEVLIAHNAAAAGIAIDPAEHNSAAKTTMRLPKK